MRILLGCFITKIYIVETIQKQERKMNQNYLVTLYFSDNIELEFIKCPKALFYIDVKYNKLIGWKKTG